MSGRNYPTSLYEMNFYAQGMADATQKPIIVWINNDEMNTLECGTSETLPTDERSFAILRTIYPNKG